jgi:hypothetical protein
MYNYTNISKEVAEAVISYATAAKTQYFLAQMIKILASYLL